MTRPETPTGFAIIPNWVLQDAKSADAIAVYAILASHADKYGICWPSRSRIALVAGRSLPTIDKALDRLREIGAVDWVTRSDERGAATSNLYQLHTFLDSADSDASNPVDNSQGVPTKLAGGVNEIDRGCKPIWQGVPTSLTRTITNELEPMNKSSEPPRPVDNSGRVDPFDDFFSIYPRPAKREEAREAYRRVVIGHLSGDYSRLNDAARRYANDPNLPPTLRIPHPATWLANEEWRPYLGPPKPKASEDRAKPQAGEPVPMPPELKAKMLQLIKENDNA